MIGVRSSNTQASATGREDRLFGPAGQTIWPLQSGINHPLVQQHFRKWIPLYGTSVAGHSHTLFWLPLCSGF
jgi:hypothetical protein